MAPSNGHLYLEIVPFLVDTLGKKKTAEILFLY